MSKWVNTLIASAILVGVILVIGGAGLLFRSYTCHARWPDDPTEFLWTSGCMVRVNGKLVPEDRVRIDTESAE